jgi:methyl-accepting chemotaxis protein
MRNWSIRKKLLVGFSAVLSLLIIVISIGVYQVISMDRTYSQLLDDRLQKMLKVKDMVITVKTQQAAVRGYAQLGDDTALNSISAMHAQFAEISGNLRDTSTTTAMLDLLDKANKLEEEYNEQALQIIEYKQANNDAALNALLANQDRTKIAELEAAMNAMMNYQQNQLDAGIVGAIEKVDKLQLLITLIGIVAIALGITIALVAGRLIATPLTAIARASERIASGDLTGEKIMMNSSDEIGQLASTFNMMSNNLRAMIIEVNTGAQQVAASSEELTASAAQSSTVSEQIATTMQELASGADTQVQLVSDGLQTTNEMSTGFQQIAVNTQNVSARALEASEKAVNGNGTISTAIEQMSAIHEQVQSLGGIINHLGGQSQEISQIVQAIKEISAQTNLLALNASIEAARAGEHGRGFEVVAAEVRKLSQQSEQSAQQISGLIASIVNGMNQAVHSMDAVTTEVQSGMSTVNEAGHSFEQIRQAAGEVAAESEEVSAAVQQMTAGVEQMAHAMKVISEVTESSAAGTEQVTASTEEQLSSMEEIFAASSSLSEIADKLQHTVNRFTV